jgi:pimeloyl-ACP methyl ester carboxylesterase
MAEKSSEYIDRLKVDIYRAPGVETKAKVVLSHGFWVGGWIWEDFASYMADRGFEAYAPTWRGHYDSRPVALPGKVSAVEFVEDLSEVYRHFAADVIVGESAGGLYTMKAAESLGNLKALVLMNPAPPFMVPQSPKLVVKQLKYLPDLLFGRPNMPSEKDYKELILNNVAEPEASDFYRKICPEPGRAVREVSFGRVKVDPAKIHCPVYLIIGHLDTILPLKVHRRTGELLGAEVVEYPQMSHHTFSERGWEKVADELISWLSNKLAASQPRPID